MSFSQEHLKPIWTTNRGPLKAFGGHKMHSANEEGDAYRFKGYDTMTMLNNTSSYSAAPAAIRGAVRFLLRSLARLINRFVAGVIAHREYQANLVILRSLSDRELRDIGLNRSEIGEGLAEAAKFRNQMQQPERPNATKRGALRVTHKA